MMWLPERDPEKARSDTAYRSAWLWLPKTKVNVRAMQLACTAFLEKRNADTEVIPFYSEWADHLLVPREMLPADRIPQPWIDVCPEGMDVEFRPNIQIRDYQEAAWKAMRAAKGGILNLACGRGKTLVALAKAADRGKATIAIMNQGGLLSQWAEEVEKFLRLRPGEIGLIKQERFEWDRPFVIASIQTLARRAEEGKIPEEMQVRYGTVIYDEVHHLSAPHFLRTAHLFLGQRFGLSATPKRNDGLEAIYMAHIGPIFHSDLAHSSTPQVYFLRTPTTLPLDMMLDVRGEFNASKLRTALAENTTRNKLILAQIAQAATKGRRILALSHSRAHVETLAAAVPRSGLIVGTGGVAFTERRSILNSRQITFATNGVAEEGLDAPALDTLMFLTPFKSWNTFQQGAGRILREFAGKQDPLVVFFYDQHIDPARAMCRKVMQGVVRHGWTYRIVGT